MGALEVLDRIFASRELLYTLLIIAIIAPLVSPIGLPVTISSRTKQVYDYINSLKPGCHAYVELYYELAARSELEPNVVALVKQLFDKGCKIVFASTAAYGPVVFNLMLSTAPDVFAGKKYGVDYVFLGYISGGESATASLARSIKGTVQYDPFGNRLEDLPLMKEVDKATDFDLAIIASSGTDTFNYYVRQWYTPYNVSLLFVSLSVIAPSIEPFVSAKQAVGMLVGQRSAAEYEMLVGRKGLGLAAMDAQSMAHLLIIIFIVLGNATYWARRLSRREVKTVGGGER